MDSRNVFTLKSIQLVAVSIFHKECLKPDHGNIDELTKYFEFIHKHIFIIHVFRPQVAI